MTGVNCTCLEMAVLGKDGEVVFTKLDPEDFERFNTWRWQLHTNGYARRTLLVGTKPRKYRTGYLHRMIVNCPDGAEVDHINGDRLDNRKVNLRIVSRAQNAQNQHASNGRSGYRGVEINGAGNYAARAQCAETRVYLGAYATAEAAAKVVAAWRSEHMPFSTN